MLLLNLSPLELAYCIAILLMNFMLRGSLGFGTRVVQTYGPWDAFIGAVTTRYDAATHRDTVEGSSIRHSYPPRGRPVV